MGPFVLGAVLRLAGRLDEAEAALRRALTKEPRNRFLRSQLLRVLAESGRDAEALAEYEALIAQGPGPNSYFPAEYHAGAAVALAAAAAGLEALPGRLRLEGVRGLVLEEGGRLEEAVESFARARLDHPEGAEAHEALRRTLGALGKVPDSPEIARLEEILEARAGAARMAGGGAAPLVKYDPSGAELWAVTPEGGYDPFAVALEPGGSVLWGYLAWQGEERVLVTEKRSPSGELEWRDACGSCYPDATLAADTHGSAAVVYSDWAPEADSQDVVAVKVSPSGERVWEARYGGRAGPDPSCRALEVGAAGDVHVAAPSGLTKYSRSGEELWAVEWPELSWAVGWPEPEDGETRWTGRHRWTRLYDLPPQIALGEEGIAVALGKQVPCWCKITLVEAALLSYSPEGELLWEARYGGPEPAPYRDDVARALAVDAEGNAFVTGVSQGSAVTLKYSASGVLLWEARGEGSPQAIALGPAGSVVVAGIVLWAPLIVKYSSEGEGLWEAWPVQAPVPPRLDPPETVALRADGAGGVLVAWEHRSWGTGPTVAVVAVSYSPEGEELWAAVTTTADVEGWEPPPGGAPGFSVEAFPWHPPRTPAIPSLDRHGNLFLWGEAVDASARRAATSRPWSSTLRPGSSGRPSTAAAGARSPGPSRSTAPAGSTSRAETRAASSR